MINVEEFTDNVTTENIADEGGFKEDLVVKGDGIFDVLMNTATSHLKAQFDSNRLRDEDYATAYIQVYQATLQAALQIWLQKGVADKQVELLNAQIVSENKQPELLTAQIGLLNAQITSESKQPELLNAQVVHLGKQGELLTAQTAQATAQAELLDKQGELSAAQIEHFDAQIRHLDAQAGLPAAQIELLDAQVVSEESKKDLYRRQIEGFDEDYKQKILKICMDSWAVGFSVARDSFEASGIPAPMQKTTIDSLYNQYVVTELDKYNYSRPI